MNADDMIKKIQNGALNTEFEMLYGSDAEKNEKQKQRYIKALRKFATAYKEAREANIMVTPGRTEIAGNHTDHNAGRVIAASVDLDVLCIFSKSDSDYASVTSEGYGEFRISIDELDVRPEEKYTTSALIRGVLARLKQLGYKIGAFDAYVQSEVLGGSGLSSSAAFEVALVSILNELYNDGAIDPVENAQISQYAENEYFMKPCGLMDQTACAVGGFVEIDFLDFKNPLVEKIDYDFGESGYDLIIVDTGGDHADLNEDYTALEHEMKDVARALGQPVLRHVPKDMIYKNIASLRNKVNDRAILRALHFHNDNDGVVEQAKALKEGDFDKFKEYVIQSGLSSWMLGQNCYVGRHYEEQGITIALAVSENMLKGKGAWRVHGGGFAGTIQAFVPKEITVEYIKTMEEIFGEKSCYLLYIRPVGTYKIEI